MTDTVTPDTVTPDTVTDTVTLRTDGGIAQDADVDDPTTTKTITRFLDNVLNRTCQQSYTVVQLAVLVNP